MTTEAALTFKQEMEKLEKGSASSRAVASIWTRRSRASRRASRSPVASQRLDEAEGRIEQLLADGTTEELDVA